MRKLIAAGIIAAGSLGASVQANAATTVYEIDGTLGSNEQNCTQIAIQLGGFDCTFGRNRPAASTFWGGPLFSGGHYNADGTKDQLTYVPTFGAYDINTDTFTPAADDGKIEAPITGTFTIDDNGTAGDPTDDLLSAEFTIGAMVRNLSTGQSTRAVQGWSAMVHTMAPTAVNASATVANGNGGVDYVIGTRGFPDPLCSNTNPADCYSTPNSSNNTTGDYGADEVLRSFWDEIPAGSIGIERSGLMGEPGFVPVQPIPATPTGNVGATTTAVIENPTCISNASPSDCDVGPLIWGAGETEGFDNMVMKVSTDSTGAITSAQVYWTQEYRIGFGCASLATCAEFGYDNSFQGGDFVFTGVQQNLAPTARDFAATVIADTAINTLDAELNSVNFTGPVTITIVAPPAAGTATVNGGTINYDATGVSPGEQTIEYQATDGIATDTGIITITVAEDVLPVAPDGAITISTQGAAPGTATVGQVDVADLATYSAGNVPATVSAAVPQDPDQGTATITGGTTIRFTPADDFFAGTAVIDYTLTDANGDTDTGTITVTIDDETPVLSDGSVTTDEGTASSALSLGIVPGNGSVAQHTLAVSTAATSGTCAISGTSLTYTPNADFFGTDSCVVTITDGDGDTDTGTFGVTVTEGEDEGIVLPGGGSAVDLWSLSLLGVLPLFRRRRRA